MAETNVLVVEDDLQLRTALSDTLTVSGFAVAQAESVTSAIARWSCQEPDIVISDVNLGDKNGREFLQFVRRNNPQTPFVFMTAYGTIENAVVAMQEGANEFIQKPFKPNQLIEIIHRYIQPLAIDANSPVIVDEKSKQLFALAKRIADTESTVLLNGPSGSGKEVMAAFIHQHSQRKNESFVAINCAAIPENMLEATLFGYEKGAFTGATQSSPGKFEQAQNGSLLLDEISEMDLSLQAKLLRVLQEKEVERLGGRKPIALNVRVIATSNRDLKKEVFEQRFREDLYFRLNVFPLHCLALHDRPHDILPLCEKLLNKYAKQNNLPLPKLSPEASSRLLSYPWPGNVRELDNMMQRCLILSRSSLIKVDDLMFETAADDISETLTNNSSDPANAALDAVPDTGSDASSGSALGNGVRDHEFQIIIETLKQYSGKKKQAAETLGISPRTLRYKLARMRELGYSLPV